MLLTAAYVADALDTTEGVVTDCLDLDDLWEDDGTGTALLPADAIALVAARLDAWRRQVDQAVTTATGTDLVSTLWASRLDAAA
uniref:Uncharacterized protein n=1 Tax=Neobacillus citreus TaxID=2833578 RepID=A0A942Y9Q8_9BACI